MRIPMFLLLLAFGGCGKTKLRTEVPAPQHSVDDKTVADPTVDAKHIVPDLPPVDSSIPAAQVEFDETAPVEAERGPVPAVATPPRLSKSVPIDHGYPGQSPFPDPRVQKLPPTVIYPPFPGQPKDNTITSTDSSDRTDSTITSSGSNEVDSSSYLAEIGSVWSSDSDSDGFPDFGNDDDDGTMSEPSEGMDLRKKQLELILNTLRDALRRAKSRPEIEQAVEEARNSYFGLRDDGTMQATWDLQFDPLIQKALQRLINRKISELMKDFQQRLDGCVTGQDVRDNTQWADGELQGLWSDSQRVWRAAFVPLIDRTWNRVLTELIANLPQKLGSEEEITHHAESVSRFFGDISDDGIRDQIERELNKWREGARQALADTLAIDDLIRGFCAIQFGHVDDVGVKLQELMTRLETEHGYTDFGRIEECAKTERVRLILKEFTEALNRANSVTQVADAARGAQNALTDIPKLYQVWADHFAPLIREALDRLVRQSHADLLDRLRTLLDQSNSGQAIRNARQWARDQLGASSGDGVWKAQFVPLIDDAWVRVLGGMIDGFPKELYTLDDIQTHFDHVVSFFNDIVDVELQEQVAARLEAWRVQVKAVLDRRTAIEALIEVFCAIEFERVTEIQDRLEQCKTALKDLDGEITDLTRIDDCAQKASIGLIKAAIGPAKIVLVSFRHVLARRGLTVEQVRKARDAALNDIYRLLNLPRLLQLYYHRQIEIESEKAIAGIELAAQRMKQRKGPSRLPGKKPALPSIPESDESDEESDDDESKPKPVRTKPANEEGEKEVVAPGGPNVSPLVLPSRGIPIEDMKGKDTEDAERGSVLVPLAIGQNKDLEREAAMVKAAKEQSEPEKREARARGVLNRNFESLAAIEKAFDDAVAISPETRTELIALAEAKMVLQGQSSIKSSPDVATLDSAMDEVQAALERIGSILVARSRLARLSEGRIAQEKLALEASRQAELASTIEAQIRSFTRESEARIRTLISQVTDTQARVRFEKLLGDVSSAHKAIITLPIDSLNSAEHIVETRNGFATGILTGLPEGIADKLKVLLEDKLEEARLLNEERLRDKVAQGSSEVMKGPIHNAEETKMNELKASIREQIGQLESVQAGTGVPSEGWSLQAQTDAAYKMLAALEGDAEQDALKAKVDSQKLRIVQQVESLIKRRLDTARSQKELRASIEHVRKWINALGERSSSLLAIQLDEHSQSILEAMKAKNKEANEKAKEIRCLRTAFTKEVGSVTSRVQFEALVKQYQDQLPTGVSAKGRTKFTNMIRTEGRKQIAQRIAEMKEQVEGGKIDLLSTRTLLEDLGKFRGFAVDDTVAKIDDRLGQTEMYNRLKTLVENLDTPIDPAIEAQIGQLREPDQQEELRNIVEARKFIDDVDEAAVGAPEDGRGKVVAGFDAALDRVTDAGLRGQLRAVFETRIAQVDRQIHSKEQVRLAREAIKGLGVGDSVDHIERMIHDSPVDQQEGLRQLLSERSGQLSDVQRSKATEISEAKMTGLPRAQFSAFQGRFLGSKFLPPPFLGIQLGDKRASLSGQDALVQRVTDVLENTLEPLGGPDARSSLSNSISQINDLALKNRLSTLFTLRGLIEGGMDADQLRTMEGIGKTRQQIMSMIPDDEPLRSELTKQLETVLGDAAFNVRLANQILPQKSTGTLSRTSFSTPSIGSRNLKSPLSSTPSGGSKLSNPVQPKGSGNLYPIPVSGRQANNAARLVNAGTNALKTAPTRVKAAGGLLVASGLAYNALT